MVLSERDGLDTVAFLGPKGSFTHQATLSRFPDSHHSLISSTTIADVFHAVSSGTATRGVVPLQNSTNGAVVATLDLLLDHAKRHRNIRICGEISLTVHHCLLGRSTHSVGTGPSDTQDRFAHIQRLYSHPQAWGQCEAFLQRHLPGVAREDVSSTSEAGKRVRQHETDNTTDDRLSVAAIASREVAVHTGLDVIAENIEDVEGNATRFLVLTTDTALPRFVKSTHSGEWRSLFAFSAPVDRPQAFGAFLTAFARSCRGLHSRPSGKQPWHDAYLCETTGQWNSDDDLGQMLAAFDPTLKDVTPEWRWLGSWPRDASL